MLQRYDNTMNTKRNVNIAINLCAIIIGMVMLAYGSVPLYKIFCQDTGFGGTVKQVYNYSTTLGTKDIKVFFDANVDKNLPWNFKNTENSIMIKTGQNALTFYSAENYSEN